MVQIEAENPYLKIKNFLSHSFFYVFGHISNLNAINNVHRLKSCISLNKRFWAKSFFGNLQKSFCRIDLKIKIPTNWLGRVTDFFSWAYLKNFFLKRHLKKKIFDHFLQRKSFTSSLSLVNDFRCKKSSKIFFFKRLFRKRFLRYAQEKKVC